MSKLNTHCQTAKPRREKKKMCPRSCACLDRSPISAFMVSLSRKWHQNPSQSGMSTLSRAQFRLLIPCTIPVAPQPLLSFLLFKLALRIPL
ncbi:hypothetical protein OXX80_000573 [Metschnikowia pulcherrima]